MGIELTSGNIFIPEVPESIKTDSPALYDYLQKLKRGVDNLSRGGFSNSLNIAAAVNLGTSGTFVISSGGSIIITSGIVISVTS